MQEPSLPLFLMGADMETFSFKSHPFTMSSFKTFAVGLLSSSESLLLSILDGLDISRMPLRTLRSAMTIIPQSPLLLAASIRENLDPDLTCTDDQIWSALHTCHLTEFVKKQPNQLEQHLLTGETYISTGQRQLLALARALLRKKKILVLDEATSAMDVETEKVVQSVLTTHFADCTVIAVAHRIATIIGFDHIICMSNGEVIESGAPAMLLQARGEFWALSAEQKCV